MSRAMIAWLRAHPGARAYRPEGCAHCPGHLSIKSALRCPAGRAALKETTHE